MRKKGGVLLFTNEEEGREGGVDAKEISLKLLCNDGKEERAEECFMLRKEGRKELC
jgi:hypothetical protein